MDTTTLLVAVGACFFIAGGVKGVIGIGLPTVGVGLLGLFMPPAQAAAILIVPSLITNTWQAVVGGHFWMLLLRLWPFLVGVLFGSLVGALWLPSNMSEASRWMGIALVLYGLLGLFKVKFVVPTKHETWLGLVMGTLTGAVTVVTGVFAIPALPFMNALQFDRNRLVQAIGISTTVSTIALALALSHAGQMTPDVFWPSAIALAAACLGMIVGQRIRQRVSAQTFRICFYAGLLILGLHLAVRGLF